MFKSIFSDNFLARKLLALDMPVGVSFFLQIARRESNWEKIACLNGGMHRQGCLREPSSGRGCFILTIDDINTSNTELWKYVDDTTIESVLTRRKTAVSNLMWKN